MGFPKTLRNFKLTKSNDIVIYMNCPVRTTQQILDIKLIEPN